MDESTVHARNALFVSVEGGARRRFDPRPEPVVFGRGTDVDLPVCRRDHTAVSRRVGTFVHQDGLWWVSNVSAAHALYVVASDHSLDPLPVRTATRVASRVVSPPGVDLVILVRDRRIRLAVETERLPPEPIPGSSEDPDCDPTTPRQSLSPRIRFLLSAKFLSEGAAGPILGDKESAALIREHRPHDKVTEAAVMGAAKKARDLLEAHGVPDLAGRGATPHVRRELLAWGYLTEDDGRWMRSGG